MKAVRARWNVHTSKNEKKSILGKDSSICKDPEEGGESMAYSDISSGENKGEWQKIRPEMLDRG